MRGSLSRVTVLLLATALTTSIGGRASAAADQWTQWRGAAMTGVVEDDPALPERWSGTENVAWKTTIPGLGWSSPIVWGNQVFVTSVIANQDGEKPRKGLYLPPTGTERMPDPAPGTHQWKVYCLDLQTGAVRWERVAHEGSVGFPRHPKNSYASETPVTDGERVYVLFGNLGLFTYDLQGTLLWSHRLEPQLDQWGWGSGASPTLLGDQLLGKNILDEMTLASPAVAGGRLLIRTASLRIQEVRVPGAGCWVLGASRSCRSTRWVPAHRTRGPNLSRAPIGRQSN